MAPGAEYLDLERRVDGLKAAHVGFLKVARVYQSETYDYPTMIQESVAELGGAFRLSPDAGLAR